MAGTTRQELAPHFRLLDSDAGCSKLAWSCLRRRLCIEAHPLFIPPYARTRRGGGTRRLRERKLGANRFHGPLSQLPTDTLKNSHARSAQQEEDSHSLRSLLRWP